MFRKIIGLLKYPSQIRLIFYTHFQVHKKLKNKKKECTIVSDDGGGDDGGDDGGDVGGCLRLRMLIGFRQ
jgi:hypothetical protein